MDRCTYHTVVITHRVVMRPPFYGVEMRSCGSRFPAPSIISLFCESGVLHFGRTLCDYNCNIWRCNQKWTVIADSWTVSEQWLSIQVGNSELVVQTLSSIVKRYCNIIVWPGLYCCLLWTSSVGYFFTILFLHKDECKYFAIRIMANDEKNEW